VNRDHDQLKVTQDFLRDGQISVDIFALTRSNDTAALVGDQASANRDPRDVCGRRRVVSDWRARRVVRDTGA